MLSFPSHTHLQATQVNSQTKACNRVCLPNRKGTLKTRYDSPLTQRRAVCKEALQKSGFSDTYVTCSTAVCK